MILIALFPGSFVLSMAYSEALMLTIVALCFIALRDKHWLWAGILAAMATAIGMRFISCAANSARRASKSNEYCSGDTARL